MNNSIKDKISFAMSYCEKACSSFWKKAVKSTNKMSRPLLFLIMFISFVVFTPMIIYMSAWTYQFIIHNSLIKFSDLKDLIHEIISVQAVALYAFMFKCWIDRDNNGIPDHLEEKENKESREGRGLKLKEGNEKE